MIGGMGGSGTRLVHSILAAAGLGFCKKMNDAHDIVFRAVLVTLGGGEWGEGKVSANVERLVLGCIEADVCK